jgi:protein-S-isoprenylcysteine O-methyltransferase Ste14
MEMDGRILCAVLGWIIWCGLHSALISITVTGYLAKKLRGGFRFYRLFYNTFSLITLVPLLSYSASIRQEPVFRWHGPMLPVKWLLLAAGIFLFLSGGRGYSVSKFLGIHQIKTKRENGSLSESGPFAASGIHKVIRHPWYLGGMMIVWARDLSLPIILINSVITSYFIVGAFLEERKLIRELGEPYRRYRATVSMFFPYRWMKTRMADGSGH